MQLRDLHASCLLSVVIGPPLHAGVVAQQLENEEVAMLLTDVNTGLNFADGGQRWWRHRVAMHGVLHSGRVVQDQHSEDRKSLGRT